MPAAASGETLSERAQRILGFDLDAWLFNELKCDNQPAPASRSEQVAIAQRKHRQRTQSYIQALEQEVLRLRNVELEFKAQVQVLQEQLQVHHDSANNTEWTPTATASEGVTSPCPETVHVHWGDLYNTLSNLTCSISAAESLPEPWIAPTDELLSADKTQTFDAMLTHNTINAGEAQAANPEEGSLSLNPSLGVNLILKLERSCLPHLKHAITAEPVQEGFLSVPYNFGTNHTYNLSTRLYREYKHTSANETQITDSDLQVLLEASERLKLANELTPVQIWALVCKLNSVQPLDTTTVTAMFENLSTYSYCNSFGSAVDKATVKAALGYYLGWTQLQ